MWNKACDKRLARLISHISHTLHYRQYCFVVDKIEDCQLGPFQDASFVKDRQASKSTSGIFCVFGPQTCVPISWMCKRQTAVSHSSAESDKHFFGRRFANRSFSGIAIVGLFLRNIFALRCYGKLFAPKRQVPILFLILLIIFLWIRLVSFQEKFQRVHSRRDCRTKGF